MKLKYYLRGMGIGIVVTTLLFMIFISMHRNEGEDKVAIVPQNTESKTVGQLHEDRQAVPAETETKEPSVEPDAKQPAVSGQEQPQDAKTDKEPPTKSKEETPENQKPEEDHKTESSPEPETPVQPEPKQEEKVRIEISGGQFSDVVCRKLEEAGLIDNAKAFNDYLVQKDYDNGILPGIYEIPKGSTYEEIAVLLTTKVE